MLANEDWCNFFPSWEIIHLPRYRSDHAPLLLKTGVNDAFCRGQKLFKFEALWLSKEECGKIVEDAWGDGVGEDMVTRLDLVSRRLSDWAVATFGNLKKRKKEALQLLNRLQQRSPDATTLEQCKEVSTNLDEIHKLVESYWHC